MRGFIADCLLRVSSGCYKASVVFKNCALAIWKRPDMHLRGRAAVDLIVTKHENIRGQE